MDRIYAIIQARMHSTRLPGKIIKEICGKPMICHIIDRVKRVDNIDDIIVATTDTKIDDVTSGIVTNCNIKCYRGDEYNVLKRFYDAATKYGAEHIVRFTCDNPLIDPAIISNLITSYVNHGCKYSTMKKYPLGLGAEVFSYKSLKEAYENATKDFEKEHVTPYMYVNRDDVNIMISDIDYSDYRFTVDTEEDFMFVSSIYNELYYNNKMFNFDDIINLLTTNPQLREINNTIKQKKLGE